MADTCRNYLPAEWAPQSGVMLTWPHVHGDWAKRLKQVEPVFVEIARQVTRRENVLISCYDREHREYVGKLLSESGVDMGRVILRTVPSNDTWARDHGPMTVLCTYEALLLDFGFNGWGGKYGFELDNQINRKLYTMDVFKKTPMQTVEMILEGGSIEVDGSGTLLTTARCLLAPTRNPNMTLTQLEQHLKELLGINRILWLHHGYLAGDDTDSHVDTLARFCDSHTIAYVRCDDPQDEHFAELKAMEDELKVFRAADGQPYRLVPLPWPSAKFDEDGNRLPATYANFLIINGAVLVPTYEDPADDDALTQLKGCFPDREVVAINCLPLIYQFGSLHCVTMQLPEGVL
ncbi:MAG: agmatine deiminase family protein [Sulfuricaulis sp.]|uniref:agmatine deiminase family protein n=1 Tax=Sulfuricaulis sp. TaxID=2003553 RepID=UPI0025F9A316|nr:agmatine deiminase family protein [Sulfuricaulis sp.]MCR4347451.1 agmatine deiminase family protein [Sulfuricaulis sp.]